MSLLSRRAIGGQVPIPFLFTIDTSLGAGNTIQLPLPSGETYNFIVDWGDASQDTITAYDQAETLHDYGAPFTGQISIAGKCGGFTFNNVGDKLKATAVDRWGNVGFDYIEGAFYGCTNLSSVSSAESINSSGSTILDLFFTGCSSLSAVNFDIFHKLNITSARGIFANSGLSTIPTGLLDYGYTNCTDLTSLFNGCNVTSIPADLLKYCPSVLDMTSVFANLNITTLPTDIFRYNTLVTDFSAALQGSSITTLPTDIFRYNVNVTNFSSTFNNSNITTLPTDIFRYNVNVTDFGAVFFDCILLTALPNNLFFYNTLVTDYSFALYRLRNIALPTTIFNLSNLSIVTTFNEYMSAELVGYSHTGSTQDIWNYTSATSVDTFLDQTALTNYAAIPNAWKGL